MNMAMTIGELPSKGLKFQTTTTISIHTNFNKQVLGGRRTSILYLKNMSNKNIYNKGKFDTSCNGYP